MKYKTSLGGKQQGASQAVSGTVAADLIRQRRSVEQKIAPATRDRAGPATLSAHRTACVTSALIPPGRGGVGRVGGGGHPLPCSTKNFPSSTMSPPLTLPAGWPATSDTQYCCHHVTTDTRLSFPPVCCDTSVWHCQVDI